MSTVPKFDVKGLKEVRLDRPWLEKRQKDSKVQIFPLVRTGAVPRPSPPPPPQTTLRADAKIDLV
jgi:hypothetical protein